jgi:hypothetical protein
LLIPPPPLWGGAGFFGADGGIVDFEFKAIHAILAHNAEAVA